MTTVAQPTTAQLVSALAASLLPLAGPAGVAAAAVIPALEQLIATFKNHGTTNFTVEQLAAIVAEGNAELATLRGNVEQRA